MKRGEIWTVAGGPGYAGKPRPALILQSDLLIRATSVITCGFTTASEPEELVRPRVDPTTGNGLSKPSGIMVDKVVTVPRTRLGKRIGALSDEDMARIEQALLLVLGFAD